MAGQMAAAGLCAPCAVLLHMQLEDGRWRLRLQAGGRLAPQVRRKLYGPHTEASRGDPGLLWESRAGEHRRVAKDQAILVAAQLCQRGFALLAEVAPQPSGGEATHVFYPRLAIECPSEVENLKDEAGTPDPAVLRVASRRRGEGESGPLRVKVAGLKASAGFERRLRERAPWLWCLEGAPERLTLLVGGVEALCTAIAASGHCLSAAVGDMRIFKRRPTQGPCPLHCGFGSDSQPCSATTHDEGAASLCSGLCANLAGIQSPQATKALGAEPWQWIESCGEEQEPQILGVEDVGAGTPKAAKHIRISCPGVVSEDDIDIESIPNGVSVRIEARKSTFKHEFQFDYRTEGHLTLCEDECSLERGVLLLSLRRSPQRRLRLGSLRGAAPAPLQAQEEREGMEVFPQGMEVFPLTPTVSEAGSSSTSSSPSSGWYFLPELRGTLVRRGLEIAP